MTNKNYRIGASFERRFVNELLKTGKAIKANRFYASRGIADVYWLDKNGTYHEAQLKYSHGKPYISPQEKERIVQYAEKFPQITVWIILKSYRKDAVWEKINTFPIYNFLTHVKVLHNGCWEWTGVLNHHGYGTLKVVGFSTRLSHRIMYDYFYDDLDPNLTIDHLCRNRACVNPIHLQQVTMQENQKRGLVNQYKYATHCISGHSFSGDNLTIQNTGQRMCKICHRISNKKYREKQSRKPLTMERVI